MISLSFSTWSTYYVDDDIGLFFPFRLAFWFLPVQSLCNAEYPARIYMRNIFLLKTLCVILLWPKASVGRMYCTYIVDIPDLEIRNIIILFEKLPMWPIAQRAPPQPAVLIISIFSRTSDPFCLQCALRMTGTVRNVDKGQERRSQCWNQDHWQELIEAEAEYSMIIITWQWIIKLPI